MSWVRKCYGFAFVLTALTGVAYGGDPFLPATEPDRSYPVPLPSLTDAPSTTTQPEPAATASGFGQPGTSHWLMVMMPCYAPGAKELVSVLDVERDYFFLKNTSLNVHLQGFYFDQLGPNAWAYGPAITIRHAFCVSERSRFFLAGGVGAMYSDNPIPEVIGSKFNLTPRASLGYVHVLNKQTSIISGIRVSHIDSLVEPGYSRTVVQYFIGLSVILY